jgi:hypothetical protein
MEIVSDPRFTQESNLIGLPLAAALKETILANGLVDKLNKVYGWNLPKNLILNGRQTNDIIYEIVLKPGYSLEKFLIALDSGNKL